MFGITALGFIAGGVFSVLIFMLGWAIGYSTGETSGKLEALEEQHE